MYPLNNPRSMIACAADVSWYSSSSTTRYASRSAADTAGTRSASRAAIAIWSANSTSPSRALSRW